MVSLINMMVGYCQTSDDDDMVRCYLMMMMMMMMTMMMKLSSLVVIRWCHRTAHPTNSTFPAQQNQRLRREMEIFIGLNLS